MYEETLIYPLVGIADIMFCDPVFEVYLQASIKNESLEKKFCRFCC